MAAQPASLAPLLVLSLLALLAAVRRADAEGPLRPDDDPRVTPTVKLVRKCLPAIVSVRVQRPTDKKDVIEFGHGGGSVIHADGYILTNNHVVANNEKVEVAFFQGEWKPASVLARLAAEDLALLHVAADGPLPVLPLGRSDDLELGEPVITFGSPGGLPHTLSTGIISGLGRATNTEHAHLPSMVQTTAPISGGSSGGPLINARGEQIGMITSRKADGENLGFAITINRAKEMIPKLISAEERYGITHGLTVDTVGPVAKVAAIAPRSPAATAGLQVGDVLLSVDGKPLRHGVDYYIALINRQPGEKLPLRLRRGEAEMEVELVLGETLAVEPVITKDLQGGLQAAVYEGHWERLPEFDKLQPKEKSVKTGPPWFTPTPAVDDFGVVLSGYVKIPRDGLYEFFTESDDGSRLWLSERLIVDNDGLHSKQQVTGLVRLKKGTYPLRIEYFDAGGDQFLAIGVEEPGGKRRQLPANWLFHQP